MCNPDYQRMHIVNDDEQDVKIETLRRRYPWVILAAFFGSSVGSFGSNYAAKTAPGLVGSFASMLGIG